MTIHRFGTSPRGTVATVPPRDGSPSGREAGRPRAGCTADSAGGLTFDVRPADCADGEPGIRRASGGAAMLLRLRGGRTTADTVRLPLAPVEEGTLRAVLPGTLWLREGRWDACLAVDGEEPRRLLPGVHDLRSLIDRVPTETHAWLGVRIPYATKYGNLTVRSWLRWPHAEAGPLHVADGAMLLRGGLFGARLSATACLEAHPRGGAGAPVTVPAHPDAQGHDGGRQARGFTARLLLEALSPGQRVWDLWLRPSAEGRAVRLARILDDVPDKKQIFSYPPQRVTDPEGAVCSVRPYYTLDNDLSVRVSREAVR